MPDLTKNDGSGRVGSGRVGSGRVGSGRVWYCPGQNGTAQDGYDRMLGWDVGCRNGTTQRKA